MEDKPKNSLKQTSKKGETRETRRERAWDLRCAGNSYPIIAAAIGCSVSTAWELIQRTEQEAHRLLGDRAAQAKLEHLGQLEVLKEKAFNDFSKSSRPGQAVAIVKIIEMERKILGLDSLKVQVEAVTAKDALDEAESASLQYERFSRVSPDGPKPA